MADENRCGRCGRFMKCLDDHASEGYVEGYYYECQGAACQEAERAAEAQYWGSVDLAGLEAAFGATA